MAVAKSHSETSPGLKARPKVLARHFQAQSGEICPVHKVPQRQISAQLWLDQQTCASSEEEVATSKDQMGSQDNQRSSKPEDLQDPWLDCEDLAKEDLLDFLSDFARCRQSLQTHEKSASKEVPSTELLTRHQPLSLVLPSSCPEMGSRKAFERPAAPLQPRGWALAEDVRSNGSCTSGMQSLDASVRSSTSTAVSRAEIRSVESISSSQTSSRSKLGKLQSATWKGWEVNASSAAELKSQAGLLKGWGPGPTGSYVHAPPSSPSHQVQVSPRIRTECALPADMSILDDCPSRGLHGEASEWGLTSFLSGIWTSSVEP